MWRAAHLSEQRAGAQLDRLSQLAGPHEHGAPSGAGGCPFWVTAESLKRRRHQERRLLVAAAALVSELWQWEGQGAEGGEGGGGGEELDPSPPLRAPGGRGSSPASRPEWGRTGAALDYWMRREGWQGATPAQTRAARAAIGSGSWCVHCGCAVRELRLFVRDGSYRAFSRCEACALVAELRPGTVLATVCRAI